MYRKAIYLPIQEDEGEAIDSIVKELNRKFRTKIINKWYGYYEVTDLEHISIEGWVIEATFEDEMQNIYQPILTVYEEGLYFGLTLQEKLKCRNKG